MMNSRIFTTDHGRSEHRYKCRRVLRETMAVCPHCEEDVSEWAERIEAAEHPPNTPKVWTCPECESVLGISDWGPKQA